MNTDHDHETCKAYFAQLSEFIDRELGDEACNEIRKHIEGCDCCAACLDTLKQTIELCHNMGEKPVPKDLSRKLKRLVYTDL
jgi:anti-sigma factor RsiW